MKAPTATPIAAVRAGDLVITLILLATFVFAYVSAQAWPFEARLFPQMLATAGMVFAVLKLVGFGIQVRRYVAWRRRLGPGSAAVNENDLAGQNGDQDPEYLFGTAGRRAWAAALGWVTAFFVALWMLGVFVTVPLFAFSYLKVAGRTGYLSAAVYAGVAGGMLWLVFSYFLEVPMPAGIGIL
jgi:hypothetical protein